MTSYLQNLSFELYNGMKFPSSSSGIFFLILPLFVLFLGSLIYIFQSRLIYLPQLPPGSRQEVWLPSRFGYGPGKRAITNNDEENHKKDDDCCTDDQCTWEELIIDTPDGEKLQAYWIVAPSKWSQKAETETENEITKRKGKLIDDSSSSGEPYTILYMQANAGNIGHRLPIARKLQESIDCNVLLLSYRGYGKSSGIPSERGIKIDSQTALDYVWNQKLSPGERSKVLVYGQSIGGAVAIHLAHSNPSKIRQVILENTFLSIPKLIPRVAPVLTPFAFLCTQQWNSFKLVPNLSQKILFLAGKKDELIPPDHMIQLHQSARRSCLKKFVTFQNGTHNDTCIQDGYFEAIQEFLNSKTPVPRVSVEEVTDEDS